jgi:hypothetical protein
MVSYISILSQDSTKWPVQLQFLLIDIESFSLPLLTFKFRTWQVSKGSLDLPYSKWKDFFQSGISVLTLLSTAWALSTTKTFRARSGSLDHHHHESDRGIGHYFFQEFSFQAVVLHHNRLPRVLFSRVFPGENLEPLESRDMREVVYP